MLYMHPAVDTEGFIDRLRLPQLSVCSLPLRPWVAISPACNPSCFRTGQLIGSRGTIRGANSHFRQKEGSHQPIFSVIVDTWCTIDTPFRGT